MAAKSNIVAEEILGSMPKNTSVSFRYRAGDTGYNASKQYRAASLIKLPLAVALFMGVEEKALRLDEMIVLEEKDKVKEGFSQHGAVDKSEVGSEFMVEDLVRHALAESDNTATNMLIDYVTMDSVNRAMEKRGYSGTVLARKMIDREAREKGVENYTTPDDMSRMFEALHNGELLPQKYCKQLLKIMSQSTITTKITRDLPEGTKVPRKGGTLNEFTDSTGKVHPSVVHDTGIVYAPGTPYVISIFTEGMEKDAASDLIARTSRRVYDSVSA